MLHAHRNRGVDRGPAVIGQLRYRRKDLLQVAADMNEWRKLGGRNSRENDRLWVWPEVVGEGRVHPPVPSA